MKRKITIGYGVDLDAFNEKVQEIMAEDFSVISEGIDKLLKYAPKKRNEYEAFVKAMGLSQDTLFDEYDVGCSYFDFLVCDVIKEVERLSVEVMIAGDGKKYLIYSPRYQWEYIRNNGGVTKEFLARTFYKYFKIIVGEKNMEEYASEWIGNHEYEVEY